MKFKDVNNRFIKQKSFSNPSFFNSTQFYGNGQAVFNSLQNDIALINAFKNTPEVYAVISYICNAVSKVKYRLYEGTIDDKGNQITKHEILDLLKAPNNSQSWFELIKQFFGYYYVTGNAYIDAFEPIGFKPKKLFILPTQYMSIYPQSSSRGNPDFNKDFRTNEIIRYKMEYGTYSLNIEAKNILHKKILNLDFADGQYLFGKSPLLSANKPIQSLQSNYEAEIATIQNRGAMGILTSKQSDFPMVDSQKKDIQEEYKKYGLSDDKYSIMITSAPVEYKKIGMDIKELQLNENKLASYRATCKVLNFPSQILGDPATSTYNNMKEAKFSLWEDTLMPQVDDFYADLTNFLARFWIDKFVLIPDYSNISAIQKDLKQLNDILKIQFDRGVVSQNDWLKELGKDTVNDKNMDKRYIMRNLIPLENSGQM